MHLAQQPPLSGSEAGQGGVVEVDGDFAGGATGRAVAGHGEGHQRVCRRHGRR
ncbi:hypothetical protein D3C72_2528820 [compost metagenome]